jgi:hypothetical protein
MAPRLPPESPSDEEQKEQKKLLQAVHDARNFKPLVHGPTDAQSLPGNEQDAPHLVKPEDVEVEDDRIAAYLRGPTAFTA